LLARAVDVLAERRGAEGQIAELLGLVAGVVGACRAAILVTGPVRRVIVRAAPGEEEAARSLAAWLDALPIDSAPVRAARGPADVVLVRGPGGRDAARPSERANDTGTTPPVGAAGDGKPDEARYLHIAATRPSVHLGLELRRAQDSAAAAERLPPATLRHLLATLAAASARVGVERQLAELRARERERERFVAVVAHELRTPLAGLGGYLDLLAGGAVDDPEIGREFIDRGRAIVERMASLVGDLLEMSRLEAGSLRLEVGSVSLAEACERALSTIAPLAAERSIRLVSDMPSRLRTARADRHRLEQVLANLVGNACKFAPDAGLIEIVARFVGDVAVVIVRDDGPGVEPADRERIFAPFARLAIHERVSGTGLGLAISRDLARAMGGDVVVAAVPGGGSAFLVGLPAGADVGRPSVAAVLLAAAEAEEIQLEERAVLRALRSGNDPSALARRRPGADARPRADSVDAA
jgi:signal transduction histidine kinase